MENKRIFLSSPTMNGREMEYIQEAFETNWIAPLGKNVDCFETELCQYIIENSNKKRELYAAALCSGTAALHLALKAAKIKKGDIVFCSSLTFSASCNPIMYEGAIPVFIDSEYDSWNMDPVALYNAFQKYPGAKAVIVVNLYGTPAKLDAIKGICDEFHAVLIEDAAESLGASYLGQQTGTFGDYGVFSFNGNKIITSSGGGMLISADQERIEKCRFWATQSREKERYYEHKEVGYNYRMSNIVAGIGRGQLTALSKHLEQKRKIYKYYKEAFNNINEVVMNPIPKDSNANNWLSCLLVDSNSKVKPNDIIDILALHNIESRPIWKPMHLQPVFKDYQCVTVNNVHNNTEHFSTVSEYIFTRGVCLPSDIKNTSEDMERIVTIIKNLFNN